MSFKTRYISTIVTALFLAAAVAQEMPLTGAALDGSWELKTACMNNHGKPGACIEMKHGSLRLTFDSNGRWDSTADDQTHTKKAGSFEIRKSRLVLQNGDGSLYQDWEPRFSNAGQSFVVVDKQLIETFVKVL